MNIIKQKGSFSRLLALNSLIEYQQNTGFYDRIFQNNYLRLLKKYNLKAISPRDKKFAFLLFITAIRQRQRITVTVEKFLKTPKNLSQTLFAHIIIMSTQILLLKTPIHATIATSIALLKADKSLGRFSGLLHGLARSLNEMDDYQFTQLSPLVEIPLWLTNLLKSNFSEKLLHDIFENFDFPVDYIDVHTPNDKQEFFKEVSFPHEKLVKHSYRISPYDTTLLQDEKFINNCWVQDIASALPLLLLNIKNKNILEVGAAPGGKTLQLIANDNKVTALEISKIRTTQLKENLERIYPTILDEPKSSNHPARKILSLETTSLPANIAPANASVKIINSDFLKFNNNQQYDIVVLDAPCSAIGTFRRHPDVFANIKNKDYLNSLIKLQQNILNHGAKFVKKEGLLIYMVCSFLPNEGEQIIDNFLQAKPGFCRQEFKLNKELKHFSPLITSKGDFLSLPFNYKQIFQSAKNKKSLHHGMDGFYACQMIKNT